MITEIAAYYRCKPVEGTFSSPMKRFVLRAGKDIENRFPDDMIVQDLDKFDFQIEPNQVYQMNIVLTTGDGKVNYWINGGNDQQKERERNQMTYIPL